MQFIDLKSQYNKIKATLESRVSNVFEHGQFILGPEVNELEEKLALFVGAKYCISVSSGTDALIIALMAAEIGVDDEVITTPFTFIATAEAIALVGAKPVFVDINPRTYNIDSAKIDAAITSKTKAIMPVSLYGQCADFDAINAVAKKHNLIVIEDAAQSLGATHKGKQSCNLSTIGCTSFFPSKPLGCYGDGGACFTNDELLAKVMREIRVHGQDRRYHHPRLGVNGRLDTLQAAILLAKLEVFPEEVILREKIGGHFSELLQDKFVIPYIEPYNTCVYAQYTIQVDNRDLLQKKLLQAGVPTAVHYPVPLHKQPVFAKQYVGMSFPIAEAAGEKVMSIPMHPYLTEEQVRYVVGHLLK